MSPALQNLLVLALVSLAAAAVLAPVARAGLMGVARALLKRGQVKWAMRVRGWAEGHDSSKKCH